MLNDSKKSNKSDALGNTPGNIVNCYLEGSLVIEIVTHNNKWEESRTLLL